MKKNIILLMLVFASLMVNASENNNNELNFSTRFTRCENRWVAMPLHNTTHQYVYGYIIIDPSAGFTFKFEGVFTVANNGNFVKDYSTILTDHLLLHGTGRLFSIINPMHFNELGIKTKTAPLTGQDANANTLSHDIAWGTFYNNEKDSEYALSYLEAAYKLNPHAADVEYQLAFAYNALKLTDRALSVLTGAINNNAADVKLNCAMGFTLFQKGDIITGLSYVKKAIALCPDMARKRDMAIQVALFYKKSNNVTAYRDWLNQADAWTPKETEVYQQMAMINAR